MGAAGSPERGRFVTAFRYSLASLLQISSDRVIVSYIRPGSLLVGVTIVDTPSSTAEPAATDCEATLVARLEDARLGVASSLSIGNFTAEALVALSPPIAPSPAPPLVPPATLPESAGLDAVALVLVAIPGCLGLFAIVLFFYCRRRRRIRLAREKRERKRLRELKRQEKREWLERQQTGSSRIAACAKAQQAGLPQVGAGMPQPPVNQITSSQTSSSTNGSQTLPPAPLPPPSSIASCDAHDAQPRPQPALAAADPLAHAKESRMSSEEVAPRSSFVVEKPCNARRGSLETSTAGGTSQCQPVDGPLTERLRKRSIDQGVLTDRMKNTRDGVLERRRNSVEAWKRGGAEALKAARTESGGAEALQAARTERGGVEALKAARNERRRSLGEAKGIGLVVAMRQQQMQDAQANGTKRSWLDRTGSSSSEVAVRISGSLPSLVSSRVSSRVSKRLSSRVSKRLSSSTQPPSRSSSSVIVAVQRVSERISELVYGPDPVDSDADDVEAPRIPLAEAKGGEDGGEDGGENGENGATAAEATAKGASEGEALDAGLKIGLKLNTGSSVRGCHMLQPTGSAAPSAAPSAASAPPCAMSAGPSALPIERASRVRKTTVATKPPVLAEAGSKKST